MRNAGAASLLALAIAVGSALVLAPAIALDRETYSEESALACLDCHDTPEVRGILETTHAVADDPRTPAGQKQCQSCHGPGAVHMQFPLQVENVHFGAKSKASPQKQNEMCLACHEQLADPAEAARHGRSVAAHPDTVRAWRTSPHGMEAVLCSTCHSAHDPKRVVPREAQITHTCSDSCHANIVAGLEPGRYSHAIGQPLGTADELTCGSCHTAHGPLDSTRCLDCHPQGPDVIGRQSAKAQRFHETAARQGTDCLRCHKGIAHRIADLDALIPAAD